MSFLIKDLIIILQDKFDFDYDLWKQTGRFSFLSSNVSDNNSSSGEGNHKYEVENSKLKGFESEIEDLFSQEEEIQSPLIKCPLFFPQEDSPQLLQEDVELLESSESVLADIHSDEESENESEVKTPRNNSSETRENKDIFSPASLKTEGSISFPSDNKKRITCKKNQQWRNIMGSGERSKGGRRVLALRADVMNKNFFRALRRECKFLFEEFLIENGFTNSRSKRIFNANLRRFAQHLLEEVSEINIETSDFNVDDFKIYIGVFLNVCLIKRMYTESEDRQKCEEFNDLLYSYSHKKFYEFVSKTEVSQLIKAMMIKKGLQNFVRGHSTLANNTSSYEAHIQKLINNI